MKTTNLFQKLTLLCLMTLATLSTAFSANLPDYKVRETYQYWESFTDGNDLGSGKPWGKLSIPFDFAFNYDNTNVTSIYVYGDGWLSFNSEKDPSSIPNFAQYTNMVSWYGNNLTTLEGLSYKIVGTKPFRTIIIQHLGAKVTNDNTKNSFDAQIRLYETTNEISVMYDDASGMGRKGINGGLYFVGSATSEYINVRPDAPFSGSTYFYNNNTSFFLNETTRDYIFSGRSWTLSPSATVAEIHPSTNDILVLGNVYSGTDRPYIRINRGVSQDPIQFTYKIEGPIDNLPSQVIYEGTSDDLGAITNIVPNPQPEGNAVKIYLDHAKQLAGVLSDGSLDLLTNKASMKGGKYRVTVVLQRTSPTVLTLGTYTSDFYVALQNDIEVVGITYPAPKAQTIYPFNKNLPLEVKVRNVGNRTITKFSVSLDIEHIDTKSKTTLKHTFDSSIPPYDVFERGETYTIMDFGSQFVPDKIGDYKISVSSKILDAVGDDNKANDIYPATGTYLFNVGYDYEGEVVQLAGVDMTAGEYIGVPVNIGVELKNNGSIDLAGYLMNLNIKDPDNNVVYNEDILVNNLASRLGNVKKFFFNKTFFPTKSGNYTITVDYKVDNDIILSNNVKTFILAVNKGLKGKYTISKFGGDFATIKDAVNALYRKGVEGPVEFIFLDNEYTEGNALLNAPAIDLSSKIIGLSKENSVVFKIDENDALSNVVTIRLFSMLGTGVYFGQNVNPSNTLAPVNFVDEASKKDFANSNGYITFDGSKNQLLKFVLYSNANRRQVFYMGSGAQNITVKNVIVEDNNPLYSSLIPSSRYNPSSLRFEYESNADLSTGILIRNMPPMDAFYKSNLYKADTLNISNVVIENNIIDGFGIGVTSLGMGVLTRGTDFKAYYNQNNIIKGNTIYNVARTGVFAGFENNLAIQGNRIFNVTGKDARYTAGIMAGNRNNITQFYNYNNTNLLIDANEISNVKAEAAVAGISVEQVKLNVAITGKSFTLPEIPEATVITNNLIWSLEPTEDNTNVYGILLAPKVNDKLETLVGNYFTSNDYIANNTVVINDNNTINTSNIFGVAMVGSKNPEFYNNAVAMLDNNVNELNKMNSAVYYKSLLPRWGQGLMSDRNAVEVGVTDADLFMMTQIDGNGKVIYEGLKDEFTMLNQWFHWTNQDANSIVGDFYKDYQITNNNPEDDTEILTIEKMRIKQPFPFNSILNNRGANLTKTVKNDIDGQTRGNSNERYDIGADEFFGKPWIFDLELVRMTEPGVYKAETGKFAFNEYIMTTSPVKMKALIRNNSSENVTNPNVKVKIYRQAYDGTLNPTVNVVKDYSITVPSIGSFHSVEVDLTDVLNQFTPETYGDWRRTNGTQPYDVPLEFRSMEPNVTPLYRIEISLGDDQDSRNNTIIKTIRFYLKRANLEALVSAENLKYNIKNETLPNLFASRLNLDSLISVFTKFGWSTKLGPEPENDHLDIDIIDRKEWEPRSINYPLYRTLFWTDGDDNLDVAGTTVNSLSNYDIINLTDYYKSGNNEIKKNFIASSQEFVRNNATAYPEFFNLYMRAKFNTALNNPVGNGVSYDQIDIKGVTIAYNVPLTVASTQWSGDNPPMPGLIQLYTGTDAVGSAAIAFQYTKHFNDRPDKGSYVPLEQRIASIIASTQPYNNILVGIDWRHFKNTEEYVRSLLDYLEKNGMFVPVQLLDFTASSKAGSIELNWSTASELNSDRFEVEKASIENGTQSQFNTIDIVSASGNSSSVKYYNSIDRNVSYGNTYAYRLKMIDNDGELNYSDVRMVKLEGLNGGISVTEVTPNPFDINAEFELTLNSSMNVNIELFDASGKSVSTLFNGSKTAGSHTIQINASNLPSGVYTAVIKAGDNMITKSVNIVK